MSDDLFIDDDALLAAREELEVPASQETGRSFVYACTIDELPKNGKRGKTIICEFDEIAVFYIRGEIYAISNICPHQASPLMAEGYVDLDAMTVECPLHGWTYSIANGKSVIGSGWIKSYEVRLDGQDVWVEEPVERKGPIVTWEDDVY